MTEFDFLKLLHDNYVIDSYQFFSACKFKIASSKISYNALEKLINDYVQNAKKETEEMFKQLSDTKRFSFMGKSDNVDYLGQELPRSTIIDKLTIEIFSLLHSFFDTFSQWINSCLLGENALILKRVTYHNVIKELDKYPEYTGEFIINVKNIENKPEYKYIADINNIIKHRYQIYTKSLYNIFDGEGKVSLPKFRKDNNSYSDKEVLRIIFECLNFCESILTESRIFVEQYYTSSTNDHVKHRLYNPKTFMLFETEEEYKQLKNIKNSIHYIEVDSENILDEYHIMLTHEDMQNGEISLYNSVYKFIAIRDTNSGMYLAILKPADSDLYSFNDGRILEYRRYITQKTDYEFELYKEILDQNFHYLPYLSDCTVHFFN